MNLLPIYLSSQKLSPFDCFQPNEENNIYIKFLFTGWKNGRDSKDSNDSKRRNLKYLCVPVFGKAEIDLINKQQPEMARNMCNVENGADIVS